MNISQKLGSRIKTLRKVQVPKLTQAKLVGKAGMSHVFLGLIERGKKTPSLQMLENIAGALGVEIGRLFIFPPEKDAGEQDMREKIFQEIRDAVDAAKLSRQDMEILKEITAVFCAKKRKE